MIGEPVNWVELDAMSKYNRLETTDNLHVGGNAVEENDNMSDDIFITPDVATTPALKHVEPTPKQQGLQGQAAPQQQQGQGTQDQTFFNLSSFIAPQLPSFVQIETRERPFTGGNTLDESVITTLHRDLSTIGDKLLSILWPLRLRKSLIAVRKISNRIGAMGNGNSMNDDVEDSIHVAPDHSGDEYSLETMKKIRDWDLWGPLVINLLFSLVITYLQNRDLDTSNNNSSSQTFSAAFTLIWASLAVLSLNIQLLSPVQQKLENGAMTNGVVGLSFFQCISLLSYAMFPVAIGGCLSIFIRYKFIKLIINLVMLTWSLLCTWLIIAIVSNCKRKGTLSLVESEDDNQGDKRIFLMVYPVLLVFGLFSWFCVIV